MKVSTKLFNSQSVQKMNNLTEEIQNSQQQIFTGKRITKPSDDPVSASMSLIVKDQLAKIDQYSRNIDLSEVKLKLADSALDQLTNLTTRVYELAIAARNQTNRDARNSIAIEVEGIRESILDLANSKDASGRSLFAGYQVNVQPFKEDKAGNVQYHGDRGVHRVSISETLELQTTVDGAEIFERIPTSGGKKSVFDLIDELITNLADSENKMLPIDEMKIALSHFADKRALIGAEINKSAAQRSVLENRHTAMTENLGRIEDADLAEVVTKLQSLMLNKEASQQSFAMISRLSLFDYIS